MTDTIILVGGPRNGDRMPYSDSAHDVLERDGQYLPYSGQAAGLPATLRPYIWNQLEAAAASQFVKELSDT